MNKLDRRFIDYKVIAEGVLSTLLEAGEEIKPGTQYIVGKNPTGVFAGADTDSIAKYDGTNWHFTMPKHDDFIFLTNTDEILIYEDNPPINRGWIPFNDRQAKFVRRCIFVKAGDTLPQDANYDPEGYETEYFLNTSTGKMYDAVEGNTWGEPYDHEKEIYLIDVENAKAYIDRGDGLIETNYNNNALYLDEWNNQRLCYVHDIEMAQLYPFPSSIANVDYETAAETHTVTADEITAYGFTLSNEVVSGKESQTLCFLQGLAQPVNTSFTVSGDSFSWRGKSLECNVNVGDVFIIQYIKYTD